MLFLPDGGGWSWKADVDVGVVEMGAGTEGGFDMWGRNGGGSISILYQALLYVIHQKESVGISGGVSRWCALWCIVMFADIVL